VPRRRLGRRLGLVLALTTAAGAPAGAAAPLMLLPPDVAAQLVPARERPLALASDGEALRFRSGEEQWEEAAPPDLVDLDGDGTRDYIVMLLVDGGPSGRRALLAREWGTTADAFGRTVFYVIVDEDGSVAEWAGSPRLDAPARPGP
jgi:hypothetical protein